MTAVRDATGRYRKPRTFPVCPDCGSVLHNRLSGDAVCVIAWCPRNRGVVGQ